MISPSPLIHILSTRPTQRGVALITALFIVFLAAVAAASLATVQQITIRRSTLVLHHQQAQLYTLGAEQWALMILKRDQQDGNVDHREEDWAALPPTLPVEGGFVSGNLLDLQSRFNLNNVLKTRLLGGGTGDPTSPNAPGDEKPTAPEQPEQADSDEQRDGDNKDDRDDSDPRDKPPQDRREEEAAERDNPIDKRMYENLRRLLGFLELDESLADVIADWLDEDRQPRFPHGAEDESYLGMTPPYRAANRPLTSLSELRLLKGMDASTYHKLVPYVSALPPGTPLNVNTVTEPMVLAAATGLPITLAEDLINDRPEKGYKSVAAFWNAAGRGGGDAQTTVRLTVNSRYFLLSATSTIGDGHATLYSVLDRSAGETDGGRSLRVVSRSFIPPW